MAKPKFTKHCEACGNGIANKWFVIGIDTTRYPNKMPQSLFIHLECKNRYEVVNERWVLKQDE